MAADSSTPSNSPEHDSLLYTYAKYRGKFTPGNLAFDANLQEFAQRISYICALENSGKVPPDQAYLQIKELWENLAASQKQLLDDGSPSSGS